MEFKIHLPPRQTRVSRGWVIVYQAARVKRVVEGERKELSPTSAIPHPGHATPFKMGGGVHLQDKLHPEQQQCPTSKMQQGAPGDGRGTLSTGCDGGKILEISLQRITI